MPVLATNPKVICSCGNKKDFYAEHCFTCSLQLRGPYSSLPERLWKHTEIKTCLILPEPCLLWTGHTMKRGHGVIGIPSDKGHYAPQLVHRVAYDFYQGPIPANRHLHHKCHRPNCWNPSHLEPLTPSKHQNLHNQTGWCRKELHLLQGSNVRSHANGGCNICYALQRNRQINPLWIRDGMLPTTPTKHPAPYSDPILTVISQVLSEGRRKKTRYLLDPMAGVGKIHALSTRGLITRGWEIEDLWANQHPATTHGDLFKLAPQNINKFDILCVSPAYGNRLADCHNARDGSHRITYKHYLGRNPSPNSSSTLQWGAEYRKWHRKAWKILVPCIKPGGIFILNVSNHIRNGEEQHVWEWHTQYLINKCGLTLKCIYPVNTRRMRKGKNYQARVNCEYVFVFEK